MGSRLTHENCFWKLAHATIPCKKLFGWPQRNQSASVNRSDLSTNFHAPSHDFVRKMRRSNLVECGPKLKQQLDLTPFDYDEWQNGFSKSPGGFRSNRPLKDWFAVLSARLRAYITNGTSPTNSQQITNAPMGVRNRHAQNPLIKVRLARCPFPGFRCKPGSSNVTTLIIDASLSVKEAGTVLR